VIEIKKMELEQLRVRTARAELEFKILERQEDIKRLEEHVKVQLDRELEIENKLKALK